MNLGKVILIGEQMTETNSRCLILSKLANHIPEQNFTTISQFSGDFVFILWF